MGDDVFGDVELYDLAPDPAPDLMFNHVYVDPLESAASPDSISDFLGSMPPVSDWVYSVVGDQYVPYGKCDHDRSRAECWECNPCSVCPLLMWKNQRRPYPLSKYHIKSKIHIESMSGRCPDDSGPGKITHMHPMYWKKYVRCNHDTVRESCRYCNPCQVCLDNGRYGKANTRKHRRTAGHLRRVTHHFDTDAQ